MGNETSSLLLKNHLSAEDIQDILQMQNKEQSVRESSCSGVDRRMPPVNVNVIGSDIEAGNPIKEVTYFLPMVRPARITHRRRGVSIDSETDVCCVCDMNIFEKPGPGVDWAQCPSCGKFHHLTCSQFPHCLMLENQDDVWKTTHLR